MSESNSTGIPEDRDLTPEDWPSKPEQQYATFQDRLADRYDLEVESRAIDTDAAGRIHYLEAGDPDGEPVVLLHGVSTTAATWLPLMPALDDDFRLIVPDRPGRGLSGTPSYRGRNLRRFMVAYLLELFDELDLERPHVVGNSLGGLQAFLLAIDHGRVDRLCLVGGPGGVSREFSLPWRLLTVRGLNRLLLWLQGRGDPVENARESTREFLVADDSAVTDEFYELLAAANEMPERRRSLRTLLDEEGSFGRIHPLFDIREEIVGIERPTAFVWGTEDSFWPPEVGRPVADRMPDAAFHELPDHGHAPWLEPGDETASLVRSFLEG